MEQNVDIPVAGGGLQDFRPGQSSSSVARSPACWLNTEDEAFQGVFRTLHQNKKSATVPPHSGSELVPHSSPWTPAAYDVPMALEEEEEESEYEPVVVQSFEFEGRWCGCEWALLSSTIAGGWPGQMGLRLAAQHGGPRGSAVGQGVWGLVRQWINGLRHLVLSFYVKVNSDPAVVPVLLPGVLVCESRSWRRVHS